MPVLHGPSCVEDERIVPAGLLREWRPLGADEPRTSVGRREHAIRVEPRRLRGRGRSHRQWPLGRALALQKIVADSGIVAKPAARYLLPLVECVFRLGPAWKERIAAAETFRDQQKD